MSTVAEAPPGAATGDPESSPPRFAAGRLPVDLLLGLALGGAFVALCFLGGGGVDQSGATSGSTWTEMAITVLGAAAAGTALVVWRPGRRWGAVTVALMMALTALEAVSIDWSVIPDSSWLAVNQALAYLCAFAGAAALARVAPHRWPALLGGVAVAMTVLCAWSLLVKVFPATLAVGNRYGRLQAPFGYWNALGLSGALGLPACLWLGARRDTGRRLAGLAAPAMAVLVSVLVLSYSRSADLAAVVIVVLWLRFTPLRLRAVALLVLGAIGAAAISVWALTHRAISHDNIAMSSQDHAGHRFGWVLLVVIVLVTVAGLVVARLMDREGLVTAGQRRRVGIVLVGLAGLIPVLAVIGLAISHRGLTGEISHGWHQLTSTSSVSSDNATRVTQFGSSRPVYWHEALRVGRHALFKGVGELGFATARLRYTTDGSIVQQAHSYVFETFADLGILGLVVTSALLVSWCVAAARPIGRGIAWRELPGPVRAEREAMITLAVLVVGFGFQSTLDWTWYFSAIAVPVLACAGWLVGRGPLVATGAGSALPKTSTAASSSSASLAARTRVRRTSLLDRPAAAAGLALLVAAVLAGAWMEWRPLRSAQLITRAENANSGAQVFADARGARAADPLALDPRILLASLYSSDHETARAHAEYLGITTLQPQNPQAWLQLAQFDVATGARRQALGAYERVLTLDHTPDTLRQNALYGVSVVRQSLANNPNG